MTKPGRLIEFLIHPADYKDKTKKQAGQWYIEKSEPDGSKGRYFCGISSGLAIDAHGERMSSECVKDFHVQTTEKEILLYANHDRVYTQDIGRLTTSEILKNGDWYTEYKLHKDSLEADIAWQQATGTGRYTKPKHFGFSIEGYIPDGAVDMSDGSGAIIKEVDLDPGVALVSKPAYTSSTVQAAIRKSLGTKTKLGKEAAMTTQIAAARSGERDFNERKWNLLTAYEQACESILSSDRETEEKTALIEQEQAALIEGLSVLYTDVGYNLPDAADLMAGYKPNAKVSDITDVSSAKKQTKKEKSIMGKATRKNDTDTVLAGIEAQLQELIELENAEQSGPNQVLEHKSEEERKDDEEVKEAMKAARLATKRAMLNAKKRKEADMDEEEKEELREEEEELKAEEEVEMRKSRRRKEEPYRDQPPPIEGAGNANVPAEEALLDDVRDPDQATAKTLRLLNSLSSMQSRKSTQVNQIANSTEVLVKTVKSLIAKQSQLEAAMINLMNGMGITDQIAAVTRKSFSQSSSNARGGEINSAALDALVNERVSKALGRSYSNNDRVLKGEGTLRDNSSIMSGLFTGGR